MVEPADGIVQARVTWLQITLLELTLRVVLSTIAAAWRGILKRDRGV
jgi:hypothetical protein